jgi:hypothetical protein
MKFYEYEYDISFKLHVLIVNNSMAYETQRLNARSTRVIPIISILNRITPIPHTDVNFLISILTLSSYIRLDFLRGLFTVGFYVKVVKALLLFILPIFPG